MVVLTNTNHMALFRSIRVECYGVFRDIEHQMKSPKLREAFSCGNTVRMLDAMKEIAPAENQLEVESFWDTMVNVRPHLIMYGPLSLFLAKETQAFHMF